MRLIELFLNETTEEDRAIISLAKGLSEKLEELNLNDLEYGTVGTIGQLLNTPLRILNPITIQLDDAQGIEQRMIEEHPDDLTKKGDEVVGIWYGETKTLVIDEQYIGTHYIQSILAHELRHALDDFKSNFKANSSKSYTTPKKKEHRKATNDPYFGNVAYLAEPDEINARFLQVLDQLTVTIPQAVQTHPNDPRPVIMKEFKNILRHFQISDLFPEETESKDYKRLIKRGMDFINKELAYVQSNQKK